MVINQFDRLKKCINRSVCSRLLLLFLLIDYSNVTSQELAKIRVVTDGLKPLVFYHSETKEIRGVAADMVKDIIKESGIPYTMEVLPWSRALYIAQNEPNVLIFLIARTESREDKFLWFHQYLKLNYYLYAQQSRMTELNELVTDYKRARIGVIRNDFTHSELKKRGFNNIVAVENNEALSQMLIRDRIDFICSSDYAIDHFELGQLLSKTDLIQAVELPLQAVPVYFALSLDSDPEIVAKLNQALERMGDLQRYQLPTVRNQ